MAIPGNTPREQVDAISGQLENAFRSISENIKNIMQDALSQTDNVVQSYGKTIASSIKQLSKETDKILENERKLKQGLLSKKDIENQINSIKDRRISIQTRITNLTREDAAAAHELQNEFNAVTRLGNEFEETLKGQATRLTSIEQKTGNLGSLMRGLTKIRFASQFIDAERSLVAMNAAAFSGANSIKIMGSGLQASGQKASQALLAIIGSTVKDRFKLMDSNSQALARNLEMSYNEAFKLNTRYVEIARNSRDVFITSDKLAKTTNDLADQLGTVVDIDDKRLTYATRIREQAGYSVGFTNELVKLSAVRGEDEESIMKAANAQVSAVKLQTGINLNNRKVLESIVKVSNSIKLNFAANPVALASAVARTKALGLELNKVDDIAGSLTDFESSIQSQMEAELLTGKALNTDRARYQALTNDTVGLAKTIAEDIGTAADYLKMNRIEQEGLAKAYGMSREEISQMLLDQQVMKATGGKSLAEQQKAYALAVQQGKEQEFLNKLGSEDLKTQFEQNSLQTRQAAIQEKLASSMDEFAKAIKPIADLLISMEGALSKFPELIALATTGFLGFKALSATKSGGGIAESLSEQAGGALEEAVGGGGNAARSGAAGGFGRIAKAFSKGGISGGAKALTRMTKGIAGKALGTIGKKIVPYTALAETGKGLFDFFSEGKSRATGVGGFAESMGGTGMKILDTLTFGASKWASNKAGISIPGMETDDVATARSIFHKSDRDPDKSRFPVSTDNKQLINDIVTNPDSYPEGIAKQAAGVNLEELAEGGIVKATGLAKVDKGEVYLGSNSITVLKDMLTALQEQNKHLIALLYKDTHISMDGQKIANIVARNVPTIAGNLLNPASRTYG